MRNTSLTLTLSFFLAGFLQAQAPLAARSDSLPRAPTLGLAQVGMALGAVALFTVADGPLRDEVQAHRTVRGDDLARVLKHFGEPVVYAPVAVGVVAVGLVSGRPAITRAGGRIAGSLLLAGLGTSLLKPLVGRRRPNRAADAFEFKPFSGADGWPSGHTTMAFALATSVSDEVGALPLTLGLYGAATLTAWSRINDDRHWLSDVVTGAAIGVVSARVMNGRWRVFGVGGPRFLVEPGRMGLTIQF